MTLAELETTLSDHPAIREFAIHELPMIHKVNVAMKLVAGVDSKTVLEQLDEELAPRVDAGITIALHVVDGKPRRPA